MPCTNCNGCQEPVCKSGYYGMECNLTCDINCRAIPCSSCACAVCDPTTGFCTNGCDPGWFGDTCARVCPRNCFQEHVFSVQCQQNDGTCLYGCQGGNYGNVCNMTCSERCLRSMCRQTDGGCTQGCIDGFTGNLCNEAAGTFAGNDQIAGALGGAFVVVLWGVVVIILICVIWKKHLQEYAVFNRNQNIGSQRASSRRSPRDQSSVVSEQDVEFQTHHTDDQLLHNEQTRQYSFRRYRRSLDNTDEATPRGECCVQFENCCHFDQSNARENLIETLDDVHVHFKDDCLHERDVIVRQTSEEDISEISEVWKPRKF